MILLFPSDQDQETIKEFGNSIFDDKISDEIFQKYLEVIKRNTFDTFAYTSDHVFAHMYASDNFRSKKLSEIINSKEWDHFVGLVYRDPDFCGEYADCEDNDIPVGPLCKIDYDDYLKNGPLKPMKVVN